MGRHGANKSPEASGGDITQQLQTLSNSLSEMEKSLKFLTDENKNLTKEVTELKKQLQLTNGLLTKAQAKINCQSETILDLQCRSMRDNIVIKGIPENERETWADTEEKVLGFMKNDLNIQETDASMIDRAHRIGSKIPDKPRPIVVKFASSKHKDTIFKNVKSLKDKKQFIVQEQFPPEINERRKRLWPKFKEAKERAKSDKTYRVNWSLDKLIINGSVHSAKDDRRVINPEEKHAKVKVKQTNDVTEKNSIFRGHSAHLSRDVSISDVLATLLTDKPVAAADHNIYAYRYGDQEGCCDDGEHGAGLRILKMLQSKGVDNAIVVVTRWYGGEHLGDRRFKLIDECAEHAVDLLSRK